MLYEWIEMKIEVTALKLTISVWLTMSHLMCVYGFMVCVLLTRSLGQFTKNFNFAGNSYFAQKSGYGHVTCGESKFS